MGWLLNCVDLAEGVNYGNFHLFSHMMLFHAKLGLLTINLIPKAYKNNAMTANMVFVGVVIDPHEICED